ncbi:MAG: Mur ligase family protein [Thermoleophilia bacterium]
MTEEPSPEGGILWVDEWTGETAPAVRRAREAGVPVRHHAQRLFDATPLPVLGVTGTAGKTTTTHLVAAILEAAGIPVVMNRSGRAANAWPEPALLDEPAPPGAWLLAELTSTHLCHLELRDAPRVAVVTCLWPDHLELHGSLEAYAAAKRRILTGQPRDGWAVLNADDHAGRALLGPPAAANVAEFSASGPVGRGAWVADGRLHVRWDGPARAVCAMDRTPPWAHPVAVAAAAAASLAAGADPGAMAAGLAAAPGLPHRMRRVGTLDGCPVVDDAMAATPSKARAALAGQPDGSVVLLAGGDDTLPGERVHADPREEERLREACREAARAARAVVCFGPAAARLMPLLDGVAATAVADLEAAVAAARPHLEPGVTLLLLSPMFPMAQEDRARFADLSRG